MRLISCEIAGFGMLSDRTYDFSGGLNAFCEENGTGKTTLMVFLKDMFYGMPYNPRRKELTEREHYRPWDGGPYGGSLTFETESGRYRLERTFGKNAKEDTFVLRDADSLLESADYSEALGEELFHVDRDSFEKSLFIPEGALRTRMTDSFHERMGEKDSAQEEVTRFEEATNRLEEARRVYTRTSRVNRGKLVALQERMSELRELAQKRPALEEASERQEADLRALTKQRVRIEQEKTELAELTAQASRREALLAAYAQRQEMLSATRKELEGLERFFAKGVPSLEDLAAKGEEERQLSLLAAECDEETSRLPRPEHMEALETLFPSENTIPSVGQISHWEEDADRLKSLRIAVGYARLPEEERSQLAGLRDMFSVGVPSEERIEEIAALQQDNVRLQGRMDVCEERLSRIAEQEEDAREEWGGRRNIGGIMLGLVVAAGLLGGGYLLFRRTGFDPQNLRALFQPALMGGAGLGVLAFTLFLYIGRRNRYLGRIRRLETLRTTEEEKLALLEEDFQTAEEDCREFFLRYATEEGTHPTLSEIRKSRDLLLRLEDKEARSLEAYDGAVEELSTATMALFTQLEPYALQYHIDLYASEGEEARLIEELKQDAATWRDVLTRRQLLAAKREETATRQAALRTFLSCYPCEASSDHEKLTEIRRALDRLSERSSAEARLVAEQESAAADPLFSQELPEVSKLTERGLELDEEQETLLSRIHVGRENAQNLADQLEACDDAAAQLVRCREEETLMQEAVDRISTTRQLLFQAKERFLSRYMGPVKERMQHYLSWLRRGQEHVLSDSDFTLDIDLSPVLFYRGQQKDVSYMSAGYQDLLALCARFALVDVLFPKETPPVLLDDPFANLDKAKIEEAMELLRRVAKHRQLIYFTCHESRMP